MPYRGPNVERNSDQFGTIQGWAGEQVIWRQWVSAVTGSSGYLAGGGITNYYREQQITALWAAPQMGESRFRETQLPIGQLMAGDAVVSTFQPLGSADELFWRGANYRVEGDAVPIHLGGRLWYRTVVRRGDVTG
jgi:hypothetical protein